MIHIYTWHKANDLLFSTFATEKLTEVILSNGKKIGLLKKDNSLLAFAATCPHSGAPLCEGWLDARKQIVCPLHKYRFDPANGRNTSGEGYKLMTYPVEVRDDEVFVGIVESN
jgi:nitrite reductase/ring-hydroxylating ferredoxin subunit